MKVSALPLKARRDVGSYFSTAVYQECLARDHRGNVQGHAGYDPLCRNSAPSSASSFCSITTEIAVEVLK